MATSTADAWRGFLQGHAQMEPDPFLARAIGAARGARRILDAGAGAGRNSRFLLRRGHDVVAVDDSGFAIETLRPLEREYPGRFAAVQCSFYPLPFPPDSFDLVVCIHAAHHQTREGIARSFGEFARVLSPAGALIVNLLSKEDARFGEGDCVGRNTYAPDHGDERGIPHYFVEDKDDLVRLLGEFDVREAELATFEAELDDGRRRLCHWNVIAAKRRG